MPSVNMAIIIGHCGREPEARFTSGGSMVCNFSVATNHRYKPAGSDEWKESTEWHNVVVWGKQAEYVNENLSKGGLVYVQGRLQTRTWEKEGVKQYKTEIVAERVAIMGKGKQAEDTENSDELPFE